MERFRELRFVSWSARSVLDIYTTIGSGSDGMIPMLQDIIRRVRLA